LISELGSSISEVFYDFTDRKYKYNFDFGSVMIDKNAIITFKYTSSQSHNPTNQGSDNIKAIP